jgi:adenosylcobinamide kinase/adenosylcobinamide-phosphate guanylyltransferase
MDVVLLGSGAADGWPNPFCACGSCRDAAERGTVRGQTSALVDGTLLLDCGAGVPAQAVRLGHSLATVRHVLVTHAHVDHLGPQALLFRSWTSAGPLDVVGPAAALEECRPWIGPDDPVRLVPVSAGDEVVLGEHRVRVLPAAHRVMAEGDAVLYDVTGPEGVRLLWACDTGPWPDDWYAAVAGARFDVVLLEQTHGRRTDLGDGHLHLGSFGDVLAWLRGVGAVDDRTLVRAVHLGHHNPSEAELAAALARHGAAPGRDGERLAVPARAPEAPR